MTHKDELDEFAERINAKINMANVMNKEDYAKLAANALDKKPSRKQLNSLWRAKNTKIILEQHKFIRKAKGKDIKKDRKKQAKVILGDVGQYRRVGATRSDYPGLDTRRVYGLIKTSSGYRRRLIDPNRTRIVRYPKTYMRGGKIVRVQKRERVFVFDKKGKRLKQISRS